MKIRILFCLLIACCISFSGYTQCVPDPNITHGVSGIYPDSATGLPHAIVGVAYSTVIQIKVFTDTVSSGLPVHIISINVTGVTGLPPGFTYSCTPSNCVFPGGADCCVLLEGPAPLANQVGTYPFVVNLDVYGSVFGVPQPPQANVDDDYAIVIENPSYISNPIPAIFEVTQNQPNPFHGITEFTISSPTNEVAYFRVANLIGKTVYSHTYNLQKGTTRISFSSADLDPGIYLYSVSSGRNLVTRRMIISSQ